MSEIVHTARLAKRCIVTFKHSAERGMIVEWDGEPRRFAGPIRRRYTHERCIFLEMVATVTGQRIGVFDIDNLNDIKLYTAATKH